MKKLNSSVSLREFAVHLSIGLVFIFLSLAVFYPLLQGKQLFQ